jgi:hypothetical protein
MILEDSGVAGPRGQLLLPPSRVPPEARLFFALTKNN